MPIPIPISLWAKIRQMTIVMHMFVRSKQFFVKPTDFPIQSEIACTMPSPGFGIIRILSDIAAPIPVNIMPSKRTENCGRISVGAYFIGGQYE